MTARVLTKNGSERWKLANQTKQSERYFECICDTAEKQPT